MAFVARLDRLVRERGDRVGMKLLDDGGGVAAGANRPHQDSTSNPGTVSPIVGMSGTAATRLRAVTARRATDLPRICG
jgi:hypothetical protein